MSWGAPITFLMIFGASFSFHQACEISFRKVGCYNDLGSSRTFPELLYNARHSYARKNPGYSIEWNVKKYEEFLPRFACDCAKAAGGNQYFSIQFYGECWSGMADSQDYMKYGESKACVNSSFGLCNENARICSGTQLTNMVYHVPAVTNNGTALGNTTFNQTIQTTDSSVKNKSLSTTALPITTKFPLMTSESPHTTSQLPSRTTDSAPRTTTPSPNTTEYSSTTTRSPPTTTESPPTTTESPPTTTKPPTTTTEAPSTTTESPPTTTKSPPTTTESPSMTTESPPATTESPPTTPEFPATTTKSQPTPAGASPNTTKSPRTTTEAPLTTTASWSTTIEPPPTTSEPLPLPGTCIPTTDILIAVDASFSIELGEFEKRKNLLQKFVAGFPVMENGVHFALIHYNHYIHVDFTFNDATFYNVHTVQKAINKVRLLGGSTLTQKALGKSLELFSKERYGSRRNSKKVLVIVTDGYTYGGAKTLRLPTLELELYGVQIVPVPFGKRTNLEGLKIMSSDASTLDNILQKNDAELLQYLEVLTNTTCKRPN